ncbi:MAG: hypothetical protein EOO46_01090 [Flavobacterium sp.]|nr:MAG: hypothetical protein EOO46_01090 [Flavobacterium sp.]
MSVRLVNRFLEKFGVQVKKTKALQEERRHYRSIISGGLQIFETHKQYEGKELNKQLAGLVFSKDRAMQLHALLASYFKNVKNGCGLTILYKASTSRNRKAYEELIVECNEWQVEFLEENAFPQQVKFWLGQQRADRIFFMTDDAVFLDDVDMSDAFLFHPLNEIFSLTKGKDLLYSFTMDAVQELPYFSEANIKDKKFYSWVWGQSLKSPDWSYPLSVDGCVFLRDEIISILDNIEFNNPNSLEANMQLYKGFFLSRNGVCYEKVKLINVPCNLVQNEIKNRSTGFFTAEELLRYWEKGQRINIEKLQGLDAYKAEHSKYEFCDRNLR